MQIFDNLLDSMLPGPGITIGTIFLSSSPRTKIPAQNARGTDAWVIPTPRALPPSPLPPPHSPIGSAVSRIARTQATECPVLKRILRSRSRPEGLCMQRPDLNLGAKGSVGLVRFVNFQTSSNIPREPNGLRLRPKSYDRSIWGKNDEERERTFALRRLNYVLRLRSGYEGIRLAVP